MGWIGPNKTQKTVIPEKFHAFKKITFQTYRKYRPEFKSPQPLLDICASVVDSEPLPPPWKWSPHEVASFLQDLGLGELQESFLDNEIDGKSLLLLEADKLPKIGIKDFEKIKILTSAIRELYHVDQDEFKRSINLPRRRPKTLYLWFKASRTGPSSYFMNPSSYFKKINIIRNETSRDRQYYALENHWNRINPYREWCPHVMIGGIRRMNPMTGTFKKQVFHPKEPSYPLKKLCLYSYPCQVHM